MIYGLLALVIALAIYGPSFWVKYVMHKYSKNLDGMPGSGGELAQHLIDRYELTDVNLKEGKADENHFDPVSHQICLSPENYRGKSMTAVAVAAHEVGHALQFYRNERLMLLRTQWLPRIHGIEKIAGVGLALVPLIGAATRLPIIMFLSIGLLIILMTTRLAFHFFTLPLEWDASFGKALPILESGYLPKEYNTAVRKVLKAAALTYVAAALADILSFWRWIRFLR